MFFAELTVLDPIGLHVRPAGQIIKLVKESGLEILIGKKDQELVPASSPLRVIGLRAHHGDILTVAIDTDDQALGKELSDQIQELLRG
jgi:phosphotransferase system HPr (HPr) family protein